MKAYLNGINVPGILHTRTLVAKVFGAIGAVSGGLAVGKEGPLVHIGSCIACMLGAVGKLANSVRFRWLKIFMNDRDRRDLVTCGCAAGVAAAFRAPVQSHYKRFLIEEQDMKNFANNFSLRVLVLHMKGCLPALTQERCPCFRRVVGCASHGMRLRQSGARS